MFFCFFLNNLTEMITIMGRCAQLNNQVGALKVKVTLKVPMLKTFIVHVRSIAN
jgi:hypothetical protein